MKINRIEENDIKRLDNIVLIIIDHLHKTKTVRTRIIDIIYDFNNRPLFLIVELDSHQYIISGSLAIIIGEDNQLDINNILKYNLAVGIIKIDDAINNRQFAVYSLMVKSIAKTIKIVKDGQ